MASCGETAKASRCAPDCAGRRQGFFSGASAVLPVLILLGRDAGHACPLGRWHRTGLPGAFPGRIVGRSALPGHFWENSSLFGARVTSDQDSVSGRCQTLHQLGGKRGWLPDRLRDAHDRAGPAVCGLNPPLRTNQLGHQKAKYCHSGESAHCQGGSGFSVRSRENASGHPSEKLKLTCQGFITGLTVP